MNRPTRPQYNSTRSPADVIAIELARSQKQDERDLEKGVKTGRKKPP